MSRVGAARLANDYQDALRLLESRRRIARPVRPAAVRPSTVISTTPGLRGTPSVHGMRDWLRVLGHTDDDLHSLNVIHVAGTKGKGSTCAFIEAILRAHGQRTGFPAKTGLYTSPHLIVDEERVRLNFKPLSRDVFAKYFFEIYDTLEQATQVDHSDGKPRYLQLWALTAFHTFLKERVDVAIVETHHGGEFDATNFIQRPIVTAITTLGTDHVQQLGPTLRDIAWHKAGIFKAGAVAVSAPQVPEAADVLRQRAEEKKVELAFAQLDEESEEVGKLPAEVLRINCSVAVAAVNAFLRKTAPDQRLSRADIEQGIKDFSWPGRFQQISVGAVDWFLDSAHNELSVEKAAQWYHEASAKIARPSDKHILVFSHVSASRDWKPLLHRLLGVLKASNMEFSAVVFTTYHHTLDDAASEKDEEWRGTMRKNGELFTQYTEVWREYFPQAEVQTKRTIDDAVRTVEQLVKADYGSSVLVTGSQHLVGGVTKCILPAIDLG